MCRRRLDGQYQMNFVLLLFSCNRYFASTGRYLERNSTVDLVECLILLVVAIRMPVHRQRIGVDADDEQ